VFVRDALPEARSSSSSQCCWTILLCWALVWCCL